MDIGTNIAELRKVMGTTQEDVAKSVGVSAQAVSKWENGGMPDTELLPHIADYFGVPIDKLFGRTISDFSDIETEVAKYIAQPLDAYDIDIDIDKLPFEAHAVTMEKAREICWAINIGLFGSKMFEKLGYSAKQMFDEIQKNSSDNLYLYAKVITDAGISMTSFAKSFPYFMLFPEPQQGWDAYLLDMSEYQKIFAALAEPDVLDALYFIHSKESEKKFSLGYFSKMTGLTVERAEKLIETLIEMEYVKASTIELDDTEQTFYSIIPNHIFIVLLILMRAYLKPPKATIEMGYRKKPFLYKGDEAE